MVVVSGVEQASPAERYGFASGDEIARIDGHPIRDVLDYRFYMTASHIAVDGKTADGLPFSRTVRKGEYEDLGLEFATYLMDQQRSCRNKCVFCFIDQMPEGLRESLYFKDDDSRMSFLFGNYITLTNLEEYDVERILSMHISPVNISVHTMNPQLRVKMMRNPRAGEVLDYIPRLTEGGININAQLVLCPGINDGAELEYSLQALCARAPEVRSVAVVPVGLTRFREGLAHLRPFSPDESRAVVQTIEKYGGEMLRRCGRRTCFAADEFYLMAGQPLPPADYYENFDQLENGVGLLSLLMEEFSQALTDEPGRCVDRAVTIATGVAAAPFLTRLARNAMGRFPGLSICVAPVTNDFFGRSITVAGLVTGRDIAAQLAGRALGDALIFPAVMLRHEGDRFLDDMSVDELSGKLDIPMLAVANDGYRLLAAMLGK